MKKYWWSILWIFGAAPLWAWSTPSLVYQTAISSITTSIVSVSTCTVGCTNQVDNPQVAGRVVIEIDNTDSAANLWCVPNSTAPLTSTSGVGRKILPGASWVVSIADGLIPNPGANPPVRTPIKFFCISDGAAAIKAAVTQEY